MTRGLTGSPPREALGDQYPAVSLGIRQVVSPASIDAWVEVAFVVLLPKKSCMCEAPGWPGKTIGSSMAACEKGHRTQNCPAPSWAPARDGTSPANSTSIAIAVTRPAPDPIDFLRTAPPRGRPLRSRPGGPWTDPASIEKAPAVASIPGESRYDRRVTRAIRATLGLMACVALVAPADALGTGGQRAAQLVDPSSLQPSILWKKIPFGAKR